MVARPTGPITSRLVETALKNADTVARFPSSAVYLSQASPV
jgi:hypothetical protein